MWQRLFMIAGLVVLTAAVYWPVHRYGFIDFDDPDYVSENPYVHAGFTAKSLYHALNTYAMGNWNPLLWFSFYLDGAVLHAKPGPMHVENALLHLIAGVLLWRLLTVSTGRESLSFLVTALFLCHPMHVESVAWISERKDVLSTPLLFAAMLMYVRYCRHKPGGRRWLIYLAMLALFASSMLVKTMGVTLPAVLLLLDYWPLRRWPGWTYTRLVIEKIPLLLLSVFFGIMGAIAQRVVGATVPLVMLSMWGRIENAVVCYVIYIAKLIFPTNLSVFYLHPGARPVASFLAAGGLLVLLTGLFYRLRFRFPYAIVGWLWFVGTLVPVIGLVQVGGQAMADRYSYFPSVGLFILLIWGGHDLLCRCKIPDRAQAALAMAVIIALGVAAHIQAGYWQDSQMLFTHALAVSDDSSVAHVILGNLAYTRKDLHRAVDEMNLALANGRQYPRAYFGLGNFWVADDPVLACGYYRKAVALEPRTAMFHKRYAQALQLAADKSPLDRKSDLDEARRQIKRAIELDPDDEELGKILTGLAASAASTGR